MENESDFSPTSPRSPESRPRARSCCLRGGLLHSPNPHPNYGINSYRFLGLTMVCHGASHVQAQVNSSTTLGRLEPHFKDDRTEGQLCEVPCPTSPVGNWDSSPGPRTLNPVAATVPMGVVPNQASAKSQCCPKGTPTPTSGFKWR